MTQITIRKGNTELTVPEDQKDRYLKLGYSVYSGDKLVEEAPMNDIGALQAKVTELQKIIVSKDKEIETLKQKTKTVAKATK